MTRRERVSQLMALSAKKEKAALARALAQKQAEAERLQGLANQIRSIMSEKSEQMQSQGTVGGLNSALWMRNTLAMELDRSENRASDAADGANALRTKVSQIGEKERLLNERARAARLQANMEREDKEERDQAPRARR